MLESLPYTHKDGKRGHETITLYGLSTCAFCKRGMSFLDAKGLAYCYIFLDMIPFETKSAAKRELRERYGDNLAFPFVTIGERARLVGFTEYEWEQAFGV